MSDIAANIAHVHHNIAVAAKKSGRDPGAVQLVAVTKSVDLTATRTVLDAGVRALGENRLPAMQAKYRELGAQAQWHFIGKLQSRKVRDVVAIADLIHSVDSYELAAEISRRARAQERVCPILIEINSGEEQKLGLSPKELTAIVPRIMELPGVALRGFMTMAPYTDDQDALRRVFAAARELLDDYRHLGLSELSMGMSNDYQIAVEEGATIVRVGSALFA